MTAENILILNYHKIDTQTDIGITARRPEDFLTDLKLLQDKGYQTITFKNIFSNDKLPEKPVILTFDDAYESFYTRALPILREMKMSAVIFVPVNYIGTFNDWDVQIGGKKYKHMNIDQLLDASKHGIEIGSHSLTHRNLSFLNDETLENEIRESKEILEEITNKEIFSFSYPFGVYSDRVLERVSRYYHFAVQLMSMLKNNNGYMNLTLPRINIYRTDSKKSFLNKLNYKNDMSVMIKNKLIQQGAWATILLQKFKKFN